MSRYLLICAHCNQPMASAMVQTNGQPFCSSGCHEAHELEVKRLNRQETHRRDQALQRQADILGALRTSIIATGLFLMIALQGCDSPGDHYGPDERAHATAGRLTLQ